MSRLPDGAKLLFPGRIDLRSSREGDDGGLDALPKSRAGGLSKTVEVADLGFLIRSSDRFAEGRNRRNQAAILVEVSWRLIIRRRICLQFGVTSPIFDGALL